ncbi:hypothetical protein OAQ37_05165 [Alphaproteobacteria bacterium]|nr:hypothetical protein [Alphaproteobacteria bacterium]
MASANDMETLKRVLIESVIPELWPELIEHIYTTKRRNIRPGETFASHHFNRSDEERFLKLQLLESHARFFEKNILDNLIKICGLESDSHSIVKSAKLIVDERNVSDLSIGLLIINRNLFAQTTEKYFSRRKEEGSEVIKEEETCISHMTFLLRSLGSGEKIQFFDYIFIYLFLCCYWYYAKPMFGFVNEWPLLDKVAFLQGYGIFQHATGFTRGSVDPIIDVYKNILVEGGETYYDLRHQLLVFG